jgi:RHS repeat-associated protein
LGARLYDPEDGLFYGADPAGQGFAAYGYCGNSPIIRIDKDGKLSMLV